jgi:hypothetical protein
MFPFNVNLSLNASLYELSSITKLNLRFFYDSLRDMWQHSAIIYVMVLGVALNFKFGCRDKSSNLYAEFRG